jgi:micrococcal nuclease
MRILSPTIVFLLLFTACTNSQILICARVIDGDTIVLSNGEKVRLIGVDTPETKHPQKPVEYYGKEATAFTKKMVGGKVVKLKYDVQDRDKYGRLLAYVYLVDGTFLNAEIIKQGYGHAYTRFPFKYMDEFRQYEKEAREAKRGLWAD